jgi:hypothetical protein
VFMASPVLLIMCKSFRLGLIFWWLHPAGSMIWFKGVKSGFSRFRLFAWIRLIKYLNKDSKKKFKKYFRKLDK